MTAVSFDGSFILPRIQSLPDIDGIKAGFSAQEIAAKRAEHNYQNFSELASRLFYAAVSGSDQSYIERFLLTYRQFATPRALLLRLQKRFRELSQVQNAPDGMDDFARFRLCSLLQDWARRYPTDFYAPGSTGALKAIYKTISSDPNLWHYAIQLEPFVRDVCEGKHSRQEDPAWEWALQETDPSILENDGNDEQQETNSINEETEIDVDHGLGPSIPEETESTPNSSEQGSSYSSSIYERDRANSTASSISSTTATPIASVFTQSTVFNTSIFNQSQETIQTLPRKLSSASPTLTSINETEYVPFPITAASSSSAPPPPPPPSLNQSGPRSTRASSTSSNNPHNILKNLNTLLAQVIHTPPLDVAQEITRVQLNLFLRIEPRDWLRHILIKRDTTMLEQDMPFRVRRDNMRRQSEHIWEFINFYNHLASWVTSLVLTHPFSNLKARVRTAARFVLVARELRTMHNYSGLRAVVSGIMNATVEGDEMIAMLNMENNELWKSLKSYVILMSSSKGHSHYRTAVSNVICGVIPESEIHTSDLQRTWSVQANYHKEDPTRINWGKFATIGGIIEEISACQKRCRRSVNKTFNFPERAQIRRWIEDTELMDSEMLNSRMPPLEIGSDSGHAHASGTSSPPQGSFQRLASLFKS